MVRWVGKGMCIILQNKKNKTNIVEILERRLPPRQNIYATRFVSFWRERVQRVKGFPWVKACPEGRPLR
jgi:hypothetical protein